MKQRLETLRHALYHIIYQANTPAGRWFDIGLIVCILASVITVVLNSMAEIE